MRGGVSYFIHGLKHVDTLKADRYKIIDPNFNWQGNALVIGVGNGRQTVGSQLLCSKALINDG